MSVTPFVKSVHSVSDKLTEQSSKRFCYYWKQTWTILCLKKTSCFSISYNSVLLHQRT